jgi:hypothetical protein
MKKKDWFITDSRLDTIDGVVGDSGSNIAWNTPEYHEAEKYVETLNGKK